MRRLKLFFVLSLIVAVMCFAVACDGNSGTQNPNNPDRTDSLPDTDGNGGEIDTDPDTAPGENDDESFEPAPDTDGMLKYVLKSDGTYAVRGLADVNSRSVSIPETFNSKDVTSIEAEAFSGSRIQNVTIAAGVKTIGDKAFALCYDLVGVSFAPGSALTSIGDRAFDICESLTAIEIPDGVTEIGAYCFRDAYELKDVSFPDSVVRVGENAMENTAWLKNADPGVVYIGSTAYAYQHIDEVKAPWAVIEEGTLSVADGAFSCDDLIVKVVIPASVTHIGYKAFTCCKNLASIEVDTLNPVYYSDKNALVERATLTVLKGVDSVPGNVTSIGDFAYAYSAALTSLTMPDSVVKIGVSAFEGAVNMSSASLSPKVTEIPDGAFRDASALGSFKVNKGVRSISGTAFSGCDALKTVYLDSPAVIVAADMSMSVGHVLENADTVFVSETAFLDDEGAPIKEYDVKDSHPYVYAAFEETDVSSVSGYKEWHRTEVR